MDQPISKIKPANHLPWIDWCRFLGAFVVLLVHSRAFAISNYGSIDPDQRNLGTAAFYMATRIGTQGVLVFFVLSGFLVGGKAIERFREGTFRLQDYVIDRCSRILVPFIPALLLSVIIARVIRLEPGSPGLILKNLVFLQGIATEPYPGNEPLWSLSYEVWFYILAGACAVLGLRRHRDMTALIVALGAMLIFTILQPVYLLCWLIGALAWVARPRTPGWTGLIAGIFLMLYGMLGVQVFSEAQTASINTAFARFSGYFISLEAAQMMFCGGCALVVQQLVVTPASKPGSLRVEAFGTRLAAFSYTLYLTHNPLLHLFRWMGLTRATRFDLGSISLFIGVIAACMAVSYAFYLVFERNTRPVRRWMHSMIER